MGKNSNKILNKNMETIKKRYSKLWQKLNNEKEPSDRKVASALNGAPTLKVVNPKEYFIHSYVDPKQEAQEWVENINQEWDKMVLFGFGLGYHLLALAETFPEKKIIVVEPNLANIYQALKHVDLREIFKKNIITNIIHSQDPQMAAKSTVQSVSKDTSAKFHFDALPAYPVVYQDYWEAFKQGVKSERNLMRGDLVTFEKWRTQVVNNYVNNFPFITCGPGVKNLTDKFKNFPIILAAAGPSLENNMDTLKEIRNSESALILAVGSAIGPLMKNGITPHLVVSIDPGENNFHHFKDLETTGLNAVFGSTIYPEITRNFKGNIFWGDLDTYDFNIEKELEIEKGILKSSTSVVVATFQLATQLGGNPIVFVGQDLAYSNMRSHAEGNPLQKSISVSENELFEVEGINGTVYSNKKFWRMKLRLEEELKKYKERVDLIDASEGGIIIDHTHIMDLKEVAEKYCTSNSNFGEVLEEIYNNSFSLITSHERDILKENIEKLQQEGKEIMGNYKEAVEYAKKILNEKREENELDVSEKTKFIKEKYEDSSGKRIFKEYIKFVVQDKLTLSNNNITSKIKNAQTKEEELYQTVTLYLTWFKIVASVIKYLDENYFGEIVWHLEKEEEKIN